MIMLGRPMTASEYASEWEAEARGFHTRSDYRWMAEMLGAAQVVLEVGCGAGEGTAELGKGVVVIEQNDHLLEMLWQVKWLRDLQTKRREERSLDLQQSGAV